MTRMRPFDLAAVPSASLSGGYVYIIQFATGMVKVGSSVNPRNRLRNHHDNAATFGATIRTQWVSEPHRTYLDSEAKLIGIAKSMATGRHKSEYFNGVEPRKLLAAFQAWRLEPAASSSRPQPDPDDYLRADIDAITEPGDLVRDAEEIDGLKVFRRRRLRGAA